MLQNMQVNVPLNSFYSDSDVSADVCPGARDVALASVKPSLVDGILKNQFSLSLETVSIDLSIRCESLIDSSC